MARRTETARLRSATINVALTCCLIYVAGWTSGAGLLPRWLAAPAAAVLVVMEVSQARSLLRGLLRCKAKSEEGLRLIAEAEAEAEAEGGPAVSVLEHAARSWAGGSPGGSRDAVVAALTERVQELEQLLDTVRDHASTAERDRLRKEVEVLRTDAERERIEAGRQESPINMHRQVGREEAFGEVLTLLDLPAR